MTATCANNIRQIGLAAAMYAGNNGNLFPLTWTGTQAGSGYCWYSFILPELMNTNALLCPAKEIWRSGQQLSYIFSLDRRIADYAANYQIGGDEAPAIGPSPSTRDISIARPSTTVYIVDAGTQPEDTADPTLCVTSSSPQKKQCWVLNDAGSPEGALVCGPDDNWCGPSICHSGYGNTWFVDGHEETIKPMWYYHWTPWLNPAFGGDSGASAPPRR